MSVGDPRSSAGGVEPDDLDGTAIAIWSVISVIAVVAVILVAAALYNQRDQLLYQQRVVAREPTSSNDMLLKQQGILQGYDAPRSGSEYYRIPIGEAKKLVLEEIRSNR